MISEYITKDTLLKQIQSVLFEEDCNKYDWDSVIESGKLVTVDGAEYIGYYIPHNPKLVVLTNPMTGVYIDQLIGDREVNVYYNRVEG